MAVMERCGLTVTCIIRAMTMTKSVLSVSIPLMFGVVVISGQGNAIRWWYMAAMVTAIGALLVSSGIEHSANGWEMLGWAAAALVLLAAALAMLGLGCCADKESRKGNKAHKAPADTVKPKSRRKAG